MGVHLDARGERGRHSAVRHAVGSVRSGAGAARRAGVLPRRPARRRVRADHAGAARRPGAAGVRRRRSDRGPVRADRRRLSGRRPARGFRCALRCLGSPRVGRAGPRRVRHPAVRLALDFPRARAAPAARDAAADRRGRAGARWPPGRRRPAASWAADRRARGRRRSVRGHLGGATPLLRLARARVSHRRVGRPGPGAATAATRRHPRRPPRHPGQRAGPGAVGRRVLRGPGVPTADPHRGTRVLADRGRAAAYPRGRRLGGCLEHAEAAGRHPRRE